MDSCERERSDETRLPVPPRWRLAAVVVVLIALFGALYLARALMLPIALALVLSFLLSPVVDALRRLRFPAPLAAAVIMLLSLLMVASALILLAEPASQWIERAPELAVRLRGKLAEVYDVLRQFARIAEAVEGFALPGPEAPPVQLGGGLRQALLSRTGELAGGTVVVLFLLFFLLASGDLFLRKLVRILPHWRDKRMAVIIARRIQRNVSRYLFTITVINTTLGVVVGLVMRGFDMPNPVLWGVMTGLLNFIPYLGPSVMLTVIAAVALLTFDSLAQAALRPLTFLVIVTLEGQLITPWVLGQRLMLNPVVIFVALIFWGWLWGIVGTLLAVPLTMIIKILCDAVPTLAPAGEMMGR